MTKYRAIVAIIGVLFFINLPEVKSQFTLDAQLRTRAEIRDGYKRISAKGSTPAFFISQRTRLGITYQTDRIRLKIVPKDVRVWGDEELADLRGVNGNHASVDLHEAYAAVRLMGNLWISAGRQELVYDNQSILSNSNWNNHAIASDAIVFKYGRPGTRLHLGATWNSMSSAKSNNYYPDDRLKTMGYLWINKNVSNKLKVSFLHLATGCTVSDSSNTIRFRHTDGIWSSYNHRYLSISGNIYYQYGRNHGGKRVKAWLADADISRRFGILVTGLGTGYTSGNSKLPMDQKTDRNFYEVYRSTHTFFGYMDYFPYVSESTSNGGLADFFLYFDIRLSSVLSIKNTTHHFRLARTNPQTPDNKNLGFENDLIISHRFSQWGTMEAGWLFYLPTETLKSLHGVTENRFPQFFYLMLSIHPTLLRI